MSRNPKWIWGLVGITACVLGAVALIVRPGENCLGTESSAYFSLPHTASHVQRHTLYLSRSCTLWLKFEMKPADLRAFVATTFIKSPLSSTVLPRKIGGIDFLQQETTWQLDKISSFLAAEANGTGPYYLDEQMLFIDTRNPSVYLVYLATKRNWL
jgi:hypothetical protein